MKETTINWPGWETVRLIGRGSFGAVYEIQRDILGEVEKAALKVISIPQHESDIDVLYGEGYDDESVTSTFQSHLKSIISEYSLMRKMNGCSNVVNCDDIRYEQHKDGIGWDIFIKMELLTPLTKVLPHEIPEGLAIEIAYDICTALVLCKKHHIVHRDVKPQNIFISDNGDYKLGDFGIAKTVEMTMGGTKIGTYKYMAPEIYHYKPYSETADIYSLGLVLYWLLNERRLPFLPLPPERITLSMDDLAQSKRLSGEQLPAPLHGSETLKRIVLKACSYKPTERYNTAQEMLEALRPLRYGYSVSEKATDSNYPKQPVQTVASSVQDHTGPNNVSPGVNSENPLQELSTVLVSKKENIQRQESDYRVSAKNALQNLFREMDASERTPEQELRSDVSTKRNALQQMQEEQARREKAAQEDERRKKKEKEWADMIKLFR